MIDVKTGDILAADAEALVNTVNCVGISGRGIALQFRRAFPDNFKAYQAACKRGEVRPGHVFVFKTGQLTNPRYIFNFPSKRHWRGKSRIEDIELGLEDLVVQARRLELRSIAVPPIGSGLGGLSWSQVRPMIESALRNLEHVKATLYEPSEAHGRTARAKEAPGMTNGRAAIVGLMQRYLAGLMDPFISLLEVHKLMYFMQEAGEGLRLRFTKASYGPYAENLRHVLSSIEGHFVSGYSDGGDNPEKQIELVPGAVEDADTFLAQNPSTKSRFDQVVDLVQGFETPFGLELLSSVHWVATREHAMTPDAAIERLGAWNERKRLFSDHQVRLAWKVLHEKGWITA